MINLRIVMILMFCGLVSGCVGAAFEAASDALQNKANITYNQNEVVVSYRQKGAPVKAGQAIYLGSNMHGIGASQGVFQLASNKKLIARIKMPRTASTDTETTCFYLTDGITNEANLYPVRDDENLRGFNNPYWQSTMAAPIQLGEVLKQNKQLDTQAGNLTRSLKQAELFVSTSDLIVNNQCKLPEHRTAKPEAPFSDGFLENQEMMPYAICSYIEAEDLQAGSGVHLVNAVDKKFISSNFPAYIKANRQYFIEDAAAGKGRLFQSIMNDSSVKFMAHKSCTALSNCGIEEELAFGSPYRNFKNAFSHCVAHIKLDISRKSDLFNKNLVEWRETPRKEQRFCQSQIALVNSGAGQLDEIASAKREISQKIEIFNERVKQNKRTSRKVKAKNSACDIYAN